MDIRAFKFSIGAGVGLACLLMTAVASAAGHPRGTFAGRVSDAAQQPVGGAIVTVENLRLRRSTTVYTDRRGWFEMPPLETDTYFVRVRRIGFQDAERARVELTPGTVRLDIPLADETDRRAVAWQLPASRWLPLLLAELPNDQLREEFTRQCTYCHQQGNWATRVQRSDADWQKIFKLMARMGGVISPDLRERLPGAFNRAYADDNYLPALVPPDFVPPPGPTGEAAAAVITEWDLGHEASMQHDLTVHPDGSIYSVDTNQDALYRLDPRTSERKVWPVPRGTSPLGGVFAGVGTILAPNSNSHVAPHSLQVAPDGSIWTTLCLGNKIGRFDPATETWTIIELEEGLYPHTLRFDQKGRVWYTLAVSNHIGMIDPASGLRETIRLPARSWSQAIALRLAPAVLWLSNYISIADQAAGAGEGVNLPIPYGIDIAPDGGVWFSQLNERRIGRLDPDTHAIEMIETPFSGPRRLRFDSKGNLWIAGFSSALIARYAPGTGQFTSWKLPIEGVETPYALNVDRNTDTVWICGTNSDSLISFDPASEAFTVYPLPTRVTYTREIDFDDAGGVWASNSNFPTWQIEASGPKVLRLQPGGAARRANTAARLSANFVTGQPHR